LFYISLMLMLIDAFQEAMVKLMRPTPTLPMEHPLLSYECHESDRWTSHEMDAFYQGLLKYNKDFTAISRDVGAKTAKQCVQFYYLWKRLCPDEYKRLRIRHGKPKIKSESKDNKDTKELRDAIASVTEMDFGEDKSVLHRALVSLSALRALRFKYLIQLYKRVKIFVKHIPYFSARFSYKQTKEKIRRL